MAWDYKTGTPRWRPDRDDDMPGGPTTRKPFEGESTDRGWIPEDDQPGLGYDPTVVAAPPGYVCLWLADGHLFQSPIVAWTICVGARAEWTTLGKAPHGFTEMAIEVPDGRVYSGLDAWPDRKTWRDGIDA